MSVSIVWVSTKKWTTNETKQKKKTDIKRQANITWISATNAFVTYTNIVLFVACCCSCCYYFDDNNDKIIKIKFSNEQNQLRTNWTKQTKMAHIYLCHCPYLRTNVHSWNGIFCVWWKTWHTLRFAHETPDAILFCDISINDYIVFHQIESETNQKI